MMKQAILRFPDHPRYHNFRSTVFLAEYEYTRYGVYVYKLTKQLSGTTPTNRECITFSFHPDNLGFYSPERALEVFGSSENAALYNAILRPTQLAHFHRDSHAI